MKKLLFAVVIAALATAAVEARRNDCNDCPPRRRVCRTDCPPKACPAPCPTRTTCPTPCPPQKPRCFREVEVPVTVMKKECIEVEAIETRHPVAPIEKRTPQDPTEIRIPLPQQYRIEYRCNPDLVEYIAQPDVIRYHCPEGSTSAPARRGCPQPCPPRASRCC